MEDTGTVPKEGRSSNGEIMHYSVGAVILKNDQYLLMDRVHKPFGYAGPAGHVDSGEKPLDALHREVNEETGLGILESRLLFAEEVHNNTCVRGVDIHFWYLYACEVEGTMQVNTKEAKSMEWYTPEELRALSLEPVWRYWFEKMDIL